MQKQNSGWNRNNVQHEKPQKKNGFGIMEPAYSKAFRGELHFFRTCQDAFEGSRHD